MTARAAVAACLVTCVAHSAPVRLVLSVGNDLGGREDVPLRYAEDDARRVRDVFTEIGSVKDDDAEVLVGQSAVEVQAALARLTARVEALNAQRREAFVVVYVSSHAVEGVLHLGDSELSLRSLREAVSRIPASFRLLVVDACTSGAVVRQKGGVRTRPTVSLGESTARGTVVISSSGPAEAAQEWDSLTSSLFTHHWLAGLRGRADLDRDGRVTLNESYAYSYSQTVALAAQHPSFDVDLAGSAEVVVTEPRRASSAVDLAPSLDGRFVVVGEDASTVLLDLEKAAGAPLHLALPAGRYRLRRTSQAGAHIAHVSLAWGGVTSLSEADFVSTSLPAFAVKGASASAWSFTLEAGLSNGPAATVKPLLGPGFWVRWESSVVWVSFGGAIGAGAAAGVSETLFGLQGAVGARGALGPVRFGVGLVARPQVLLKDGATAALETGLLGSVEVGVLGPLFLGVSAEGLVRAAPVAPAPGNPLGWRTSLLFGARL